MSRKIHQAVSEKTGMITFKINYCDNIRHCYRKLCNSLIRTLQ